MKKSFNQSSKKNIIVIDDEQQSHSKFDMKKIMANMVSHWKYQQQSNRNSFFRKQVKAIEKEKKKIEKETKKLKQKQYMEAIKQMRRKQKEEERQEKKKYEKEMKQFRKKQKQKERQQRQKQKERLKEMLKEEKRKQIEARKDEKNNVEECKKTHIRCSFCLKKIHELEPFFQCNHTKCLKRYHYPCSLDGQVCLGCLEKGYNLDKVEQVKDFISFESEIDEQKIKQWEDLKENYPNLSTDNSITFPVDDNLFEQYSRALIGTNKKNLLQSSDLPEYFQQTLTVWNFLMSFKKALELKQTITIKNFNEIIEKGEITEILSILIRFIVKGNTNLSTKHSLLNFFEYFSGFGYNCYLTKLFWSSLCLLLIEQLNNDQAKCLKSKLEQKIQNRDLNYFDSPSDNISILYVLTKMIIESDSLREEVVEEDKRIMSCPFMHERLKYSRLMEKYKQLQRKLHQQYIDLFQQVRVINNAKSQQSLTQSFMELYNQAYEKCKQINHAHWKMKKLGTYSNVICEANFIHLLGKDRKMRNYWLIDTQSHKVYVEDHGKWGYYSYSQLRNFLDGLNCRGIREKKLFQVIDSLIDSQFLSQDAEQKIPCFIPKQDFLNFRELSFENLKKMVLQVEEKITNNLIKHFGFWAPSQKRIAFRFKFEMAKFKNVEDIKKALLDFHENICVVNINVADRQENIVRKNIDENPQKLQRCTGKYNFQSSSFLGKKQTFKAVVGNINEEIKQIF